MKNDSLEYSFFLDFLKDYPQYNTAYRTEWMIYDDLHKIAGTIDIVFKYGNSVILGDWKRSKHIDDGLKSRKKAKHCISHLKDCNYSHYSLQLNLYKYILENHYNQTVSDMFLVVLHPNNKSYQLIPVYDKQSEIKQMLEYHVNSLKE